MLTIDDYEIREAGLQFFYCLADSIGSKFDQYFDLVFKKAMEWSVDNSGVQYVVDDNEFSLDSDSEEDGVEPTSVRINQNFMQ